MSEQRPLTKKEAMDRAIDIAKGKYLSVVDIVATQDEPRTWKLDAFDETEAHLSIGEERRTVKTSEVFNVRQAINIGNHMLNLGFWKEGMESMIISIAES